MKSNIFILIFSLILLIFTSFYIYNYINKILIVIPLLIFFIIIFFLLNKIYFKRILNLWINFGNFLSYIFSPIVLGIIFFFVITPIGLILRFFGRDILRLKIKDKKTYWIDREDKEINAESFNKQY